jgi:hypothetical protein
LALVLTVRHAGWVERFFQTWDLGFAFARGVDQVAHSLGGHRRLPDRAAGSDVDLVDELVRVALGGIRRAW